MKCEHPGEKILVSPSDEYQLTISDPALENGESNLITKAIRAFSAATGKPAPALHLHLRKEIPTGAGLGGGSSNAAQALYIVNDYFDRPLELQSLTDLGAKVGADVPFFVSGAYMVHASGIGEQLSSIELKLPYWVLIVKPESVSISTLEAYSRIIPSDTGGSQLAQLVQEQRWSELKNDFEQAIFPLNPQLEKIKQELLDTGAHYASMSGSGSAIYGLFEDASIARAAVHVFEQQRLPCWLNPPMR